LCGAALTAYNFGGFLTSFYTCFCTSGSFGARVLEFLSFYLVSTLFSSLGLSGVF